MTGYIYDAQWERERDRLRGLEAVSDPGTLAAFDAVGVGPGWRCLEVGAGGGSIVETLVKRVGTEGRVVAVDLDTRFLAAIDAPNVDVLQLDITADPVPGRPFDLVHARAVLEHLPGRDRVLADLVDLVRPGGWLVVEDVDFQVALKGDETQVAAMSSEDAHLQAKWWRTVDALMRGQGIDPEYGRRLPMLLAAAGLEDVAAISRAHVLGEGTPGAAMTRLSIQHLGGLLVQRGLLAAEEVARLIERTGASAAGWGPAMVTAWARKARGSRGGNGWPTVPTPTAAML